MSDEEKDYYEVETIIQAKVVRKVKGKLFWKYYVKWKGYGPEENTWEPPESFNGGSEHFLSHFWERINVGGRDINDADAFKVGEMLFPVGPPRGGKRASPQKPETALDEEKTSPEVKASPEVTEGPERRRRIQADAEDAPIPSPTPAPIPSSKRKRGRSPLPTEAASPSTKPKRPRASKGSSTSKRVLNSNDSPAPRRSGRRSTLDAPKPVPPAKVVKSSPVNSSPSRRAQRERSPSEVPPSVAGEEVELGRVSSPDLQYPDEDADGVTDPDVVTVNGNEGEDTAHIEEQLTVTGVSAGSSAQALVSETPLPAHRARAANPLVKFVEDPAVGQSLDNAISTKARLSGKLALRDPPSAVKPTRPAPSAEVVGAVKTPNKGLPTRKDSLLTFAKGKLHTLKGKFVPEWSNSKPADSTSEPSIGRASIDRDQVLEFALDPADSSRNATPVVPPSGEELLEAACLKPEDAQALPDFEDVDMDTNPPANEEPVPLGNGNESSSASALHTIARPSLNGFHSMWRQSTIFGPLGLGANTPISAPRSTDEPAHSKPFLLAINPETAIPVAFKDINPGSSIEQPMLDAIAAKCRTRGLPGKLYKDPVIIDTLNVGGSSARVVLDSSAEGKHQQQFTQFYQSLGNQNLFLIMAADYILALCSSESKTLLEKLGVPGALIGLADTVIASQVSIRDHSAFADLAVEAESVRL